MSAGYWGIVSGVAALIALFFVCVEIAYGRRKSVADGPPAAKTKRAA